MNLGKNLKIESVSRLNPTPPVQLSSLQTVAEAVGLLREEGVGCLLVMSEGQLVGIFTERDLTRRILAQGRPFSLPLRNCMTPNPTTVGSNEPIASAIQKMEGGGYRHLPVLDEAGRPVGVLSVKRIVRYLVEYFPGKIYNLDPDQNASPESPDGA